MAETLRPCPLCGGTDLKHYVTNARERNRGVVVCKGCGLRLEAYSDDEYKVAKAYQGDFKQAHEFTWEQARKAVADRWNRREGRTCRNELSGQYDGACFKCSACSYECEVSVPHPYAPYSPQDTDWFCELPAYCPNCGTRIIKEDE